MIFASRDTLWKPTCLYNAPNLHTVGELLVHTSGSRTSSLATGGRPLQLPTCSKIDSTEQAKVTQSQRSHTRGALTMPCACTMCGEISAKTTDLFSRRRFPEGISFPNCVERSVLSLPLSKLCAVHFALQRRALFEEEKRVKRYQEKVRKRGGQKRGAKKEKRMRENRSDKTLISKSALARKGYFHLLPSCLLALRNPLPPTGVSWALRARNVLEVSMRVSPKTRRPRKRPTECLGDFLAPGSLRVSQQHSGETILDTLA